MFSIYAKLLKTANITVNIQSSSSLSKEYILIVILEIFQHNFFFQIKTSLVLRRIFFFFFFTAENFSKSLHTHKWVRGEQKYWYKSSISVEKVRCFCQEKTLEAREHECCMSHLNHSLGVRWITSDQGWLAPLPHNTALAVPFPGEEKLDIHNSNTKVKLTYVYSSSKTWQLSHV